MSGLSENEMPRTADRRRALAAVAGFGVASGLLLTGCSAKPAERKGEDEDKVTANEDLMREHGVLRRILVVFRESAPLVVAAPATFDAGALSSATALFRKFGERYHEQLLEEQHIFPIIRKAGDGALVDTLVAQHARGRDITGYILDRTRAGKIATGDGAALSKALTAFARMYEAHAAREDTVIFPAFKKAVGAKGYDELGEQFEEIERKEFGGDGFDMALDQVTAIEGRLGLADLARFTAPPPGA